MPIYPYRCDDCGEEFELFARTFNTKVDEVCPKCGGKKVKRTVTKSLIRTDFHKQEDKSLWHRK